MLLNLTLKIECSARNRGELWRVPVKDVALNIVFSRTSPELHCTVDLRVHSQCNVLFWVSLCSVNLKINSDLLKITYPTKEKQAYGSVHATLKLWTRLIYVRSLKRRPDIGPQLSQIESSVLFR